MKKYLMIFAAALLCAACGKDKDKDDPAPEVLTVSADVCILDYSGTAGSNTRPQVSITLTSGSAWTLGNFADTYIINDISEGAAGTHTIKLQLTPAFVTYIENNSGSLFASGVVGNVVIDNGLSTQEIKVYYKGKGTVNSPLLIFTAAELQAMNSNLAGHYLLMNDLTVANWLPVGDNTTVSAASNFTGSLDGGGRRITISSFSPSVPKGGASSANYYYGLMGFVSGGEVKNLHVEVNASAATIKTDATVRYGGIAGSFAGSGTITNCRVSGALAFSSAANNEVSIGGITSYNASSSVTNCVSEAAITAEAGGLVYAGGLVGIQNGTLSFSYATGTVNAKSSNGACFAGGLVGAVNGSITSCVAPGTSVTAAAAGVLNIGRVVGSSSSALTNNHANSAMQVNGVTVPTGDAGATTIHGANVSLSATQSQSWWSGTAGFTFNSSSNAWKWDAATQMPKLWWEK